MSPLGVLPSRGESRPAAVSQDSAVSFSVFSLRRETLRPTLGRGRRREWNNKLGNISLKQMKEIILRIEIDLSHRIIG